MMVYKESVIHNKPIGHSAGQLLIEVVISSLILLIITSGIVSSVIVSVANTTYARQRTLATYYAQRELELAKADIQSNWDFSAYPRTVVTNIPGITSITLTATCFIAAECPRPTTNWTLVTLRAVGIWTRRGSQTSTVTLTTLVSKE